MQQIAFADVCKTSFPVWIQTTIYWIQISRATVAPGKNNEVSTRFELVNNPFAEDALTTRATDRFVEIKGFEPLTGTV